MVGIAQLVERRLVVADVAGSSPVTHPKSKGRPMRGGLSAFLRRAAATCGLTGLPHLSAHGPDASAQYLLTSAPCVSSAPAHGQTVWAWWGWWELWDRAQRYRGREHARGHAG